MDEIEASPATKKSRRRVLSGREGYTLARIAIRNQPDNVAFTAGGVEVDLIENLKDHKLQEVGREVVRLRQGDRGKRRFTKTAQAVLESVG